MREGWQTKTLGDVCHVYQPETISQKQMAGGEYAVYGANGPIGWHNQFNHEAAQLILGCRGSCGSVHITEPRSWINGNAMVVQPKTDLIAPAYLAYALRGGVDLKDSITGTAQPQITRVSLMPVAISYPEALPEQLRIVALLDEALAGLATAKANAERNLQNARAIFESHLQTVFSQRGEGWTEKPFEELIESNVIGLTKNSHEQGKDKAWPYMKMNNITRDNRLDFSSFTCVEATNEEVFKYSLKEGDFLFNTRNSHELVGKSCVYESAQSDTVLYNNNIMRVRFLRGFDAKFILLAFSSKAVSDELKALKSGTTNVSAIYFKDLKTLTIPVPSIAEQTMITAKLNDLSKATQHLSRLYERKLAALEELKKSLLHQAFSGEL